MVIITNGIQLRVPIHVEDTGFSIRVYYQNGDGIEIQYESENEHIFSHSMDTENENTISKKNDLIPKIQGSETPLAGRSRGSDGCPMYGGFRCLSM